jgi:hypothetical protein
MILSKRKVAIYVERALQQWIVQDPDGNFWILPATEDAWAHREPFTPSDECELEPVPGHYKYLLELPF